MLRKGKTSEFPRLNRLTNQEIERLLKKIF